MDINTKRYRYKYVVIRNVVPGGVLYKVNETQSKDEKVKAGDRLLSVNGVTGGKEIVAELKAALKARAKSTTGRKAALVARLLGCIGVVGSVERR